MNVEPRKPEKKPIHRFSLELAIFLNFDSLIWNEEENDVNVWRNEQYKKSNITNLIKRSWYQIERFG